MTELVLTDEHIEVLYLLLNDEHNPNYYYPQYRATCIELTQAGYMITQHRRTQKEMITITQAGRLAFLHHFNTTNVQTGLKNKVLQKPLSPEHWKLLHNFIEHSPVAATTIQNEILAYDLVNVGYASTIFTTSGATYYSITRAATEAFCRHYKRFILRDAIEKHLQCA